jgi:hypothetical protein
MSRRARRRLCPALQSVFDALAANVNESCVVIIRPSNSKERQCRIYVPAVDRLLLCDVLEVIDAEAEDGEPPDREGEWVTGEEDAEKEPPASDASADTGADRADSADLDTGAAEDTYPVDTEILRVLREAGRPLAAKVISARMGRKHSGWTRQALKRLADAGLITPGEAGYSLVEIAGPE